MMYWNHHMTAGGWILSLLATVIIVALLVVTIVWIVRGRRGPGSAGPSSPLEILDRRLASGEIQTDQYEQLRETLDPRLEPAPASPPAIR